MFRNARRIAAITVLTAAAATLPAGSASAGQITMSDIMVSSVTAAPAPPSRAASTLELAAPTAEPAALLLPAVQAARKAAR